MCYIVNRLKLCITTTVKLQQPGILDLSFIKKTKKKTQDIKNQHMNLNNGDNQTK